MARSLHSLLLALLIAAPASATPETNGLRVSFADFQAYFNAVVERCEATAYMAAGQKFYRVDPPEIITPVIIRTTSTNISHASVGSFVGDLFVIRLTNFSYAHIEQELIDTLEFDAVGGPLNTNDLHSVPSMAWYEILDSKTFELIPFYVRTDGVFSNGYASWLGTNCTPPMWSVNTYFNHLEIDTATNRFWWADDVHNSWSNHLERLRVIRGLYRTFPESAWAVFNQGTGTFAETTYPATTNDIPNTLWALTFTNELVCANPSGLESYDLRKISSEITSQASVISRVYTSLGGTYTEPGGDPEVIPVEGYIYVKRAVSGVNEAGSPVASAIATGVVTVSKAFSYAYDSPCGGCAGGIPVLVLGETLITNTFSFVTNGVSYIDAEPSRMMFQTNVCMADLCQWSTTPPCELPGCPEIIANPDSGDNYGDDDLSGVVFETLREAHGFTTNAILDFPEYAYHGYQVSLDVSYVQPPVIVLEWQFPSGVIR